MPEAHAKDMIDILPILAVDTNILDGITSTFREIIARFDILAEPQLLIQTIDSLSLTVAATLTVTSPAPARGGSDSVSRYP